MMILGIDIDDVVTESSLALIAHAEVHETEICEKGDILDHLPEVMRGGIPFPSVEVYLRRFMADIMDSAAVKENASTAQSQEAYLKKYEALTERYEKEAAELERLQSLRTLRSQQDKKMALYIRTLKKQPEVMHDWNDTIWTVMIEKAIVHKDGQITFVFQNGTEIKVGA